MRRRYWKGNLMHNRGLALGALALVLMVMPTSHADAAVCKRAKVSATGGWSATFVGARASARMAWKRKVRQRYGTRFDTWWRSAEKSYGCWSYKGRERCRATARPCRAGK